MNDKGKKTFDIAEDVDILIYTTYKILRKIPIQKEIGRCI
jgi:hypothetical protein